MCSRLKRFAQSKQIRIALGTQTMTKPPGLGSVVYNGVQDVTLLCAAETHLYTAHFSLEISHDFSVELFKR